MTLSHKRVTLYTRCTHTITRTGDNSHDGAHVKTTTVRDFIHGGYKTAEEPLVVIANAKVLGTWYPSGTEPRESSEAAIAKEGGAGDSPSARMARVAPANPWMGQRGGAVPKTR